MTRVRHPHFGEGIVLSERKDRGLTRVEFEDGSLLWLDTDELEFLPPPAKKCVCSTLVLFREGCNCGAIARYQVPR